MPSTTRAQNSTSSVPVAVRPVFDEVTAVTDQFCAAHLDDEYLRLCRKLAGKLARKRPSPLLSGDRRIWAAGIVYAVGRVNFLADPANKPFLRTDDLASLLDVKQATMATKARVIMSILHIGPMDVEYTRQDMIDSNPMAWLVQVNGFVLDARALPVAMQLECHQRGLIPHLPTSSRSS